MTPSPDRRTAIVQWPYIERRTSARPAATTWLAPDRRDTSASSPEPSSTSSASSIRIRHGRPA